MFVIDDATSNDVLFPTAFGRGAVPRDMVAYPPTMFAPPSEIPLIPESEWIPRIRDRKKCKSGLRDLFKAGLVGTVKDQNGQGYCHTADTEVLTDRGFVPWPEYNWSDLLATVNPLTHRLEYQAPFERHVYDYDGPMVYGTNRRVDFGVTPDHQMYVRKWDEAKRTLSSKYSFVRAGDIGWYAGLLHAPSGWAGTELVELEIPGDRRYDGDDLIALLGLIVSDGFAGGSEGSRPGKGTRNLVSFASFREDSRPNIAALAARLGFAEAPSRPGVWNRWSAGALAEWVRANCYTGAGLKAQNKRVPDLVKVASERQIKLFLHYFDDRVRDGSQFFTTSKKLADDIQELHLRVGKRACVDAVAPRQHVYKGKTVRSGPAFTITVGEVDRLCIDRKKHIEQERYKGPVFCAAVPNHTLITRRNGTVLISSNCWAYSTTRTVEYVRAIQNLPYVALSAHSVGCVVKGFRDEGGWCGLSAEYIRAKGVVPESLWPAKSMSRSHNTAANWEEAAKYRITEDFVDLARPVYDQNLTFAQMVSCLLQNVPCVGDFNWWGHSVCAVDVDEMDGEVVLDIDNSWTPGWGDNGTGKLRGSKKIPDGAVATRSVNPS
jgi:hypothetical protein